MAARAQAIIAGGLRTTRAAPAAAGTGPQRRRTEGSALLFPLVVGPGLVS